jgi:alpha-galactosidase
MRLRVLAGSVLILLPMLGFSQSNQPAATPLAATPPMGWNSWNHFAGRVTDKDVRGAADALVSSGMRDAGYIYVNIDDTWEGERDAQGVIHTNKKFPDMKALADYVHSKGLKIGIYSSPGPQTCARYPGSYGHEAQDAKTYAEWGMDYLKYDLCSFRKLMDSESGGDPAKANQMMHAAYAKMHDALAATGRPIVYSLCQYGWDSVWKWAPDVGGNLWRTTGDINDTYDRMSVIGFAQAGLSRYAGPGHWNDPDMLEVGNGKMNEDEYRTHMSLWAILASPLLAGNDLSQMTPATVAILTNKDVVAIDQDALGKQGDRVTATGPFEVWAKPLQDGSQAVALFNRGEDAETMELPYSAVSVASGYKARDVWGKKDFALGESYSTMVPKHGVVLLRISKP